MALHEESLDEMRPALRTKPDRQIGKTPDDPAVGTQHVLTGHPAEQKHFRSMPE